MKTAMKSISRAVSLCAVAAGLALAAASPARAAEGEVALQHAEWSFQGVFGTYDRDALRRGYKVYKEVCSVCHSMQYVKFRNLGQPGGPEFEEGQVKALAAEITVEAERSNPNVVKAVGSPLAPAQLRALYFTRATAPYGEGPLFHHIGLYAYRRSALERFVALPPSPLESREKLEQLRALEAGMRIDIAIVDTVPLGVDTPEDLERARALLAHEAEGNSL